MEKTRMTEEEKGKARVIATMYGGVIPAWAMPDDKEETNDEPNTSKREQD